MKGRWKFYIHVWFPFMYFRKWNWYFQNRIIMFCLPVPTFIYRWKIYIFTGLVCLYSAAGKHVDQSWEYINRSQTQEFGNWDWSRAIPRKGIYKWDFPCSAVHVNRTRRGVVGAGTGYLLRKLKQFQLENFQAMLRRFSSITLKVYCSIAKIVKADKSIAERYTCQNIRKFFNSM